MVYVCGNCGAVHPPESVGCEDARRKREENAEEFHRKVEHHKAHCRGCPDPAEHVRELERLDNPRKKPIRFAVHR